MKKISIAGSCFNEAENVKSWYEKVTKTLKKFENYSYEIVISDNNSTDDTREILAQLAEKDEKLKVVFNLKNYGHIQSPHNSLKNTDGDIIIFIATDLEDPPELIEQLINLHEKNHKELILATHPERDISFLGRISRLFVLKVVDHVTNIKQLRNFTGYFLMTKNFKDYVLSLGLNYPYYRGIITSSGFDYDTVNYVKNRRTNGVSKTTFFDLVDMAVLSVVSQSNHLLRISTIFAIFGIFLSTILFAVFFTLKIVYWENFSSGVTPIILLVLFLFSLVFLILGIISEYINHLIGKIAPSEVVIEKEKINF